MAGSGRGRPASPTRARVIAATLECISVYGYRRATSNEIARFAGVTWGAIQRQFGSREALVLAAVESEWERLADTWRNARIEGATTEERIRELLGITKSYYSRPEFMAALQIVMDLRRDPETSSDTRDTIRRMTADVENAAQEKLAQALPGAAPGDPMMGVVFKVLRNHVLGVHIYRVTASPESFEQVLAHLPAEEELLIQMLTWAAQSKLASPQPGVTR
jgi:AcrR family transcriptional regulator